MTQASLSYYEKVLKSKVARVRLYPAQDAGAFGCQGAEDRNLLRILHPLPRVNEIAYDVDENPKAYYFQQAQNGLYARQAILCDVLGITLDDVIEDAKK